MKPLGLSAGEGVGLTVDSRTLDELKRVSRDDPKAAIRHSAQQFETLFMNMVMKNMRESGPKSDMFDSPASDLARGLLDQELAAKMAARGTGLADMIERQLERQIDPRAAASAPAFLPYAPRRATGAALPALGRPAELGAAAGSSVAAPLAAARALAPDGKSRQRDFVARVEGPAAAAAAATGIPADFIVAQAALESGWGQREIRDPATGQSSHNLFGIKAGSGWSGRTVEVTTTEYVNGQAEKRIEKFRAYASDAEAFQDYARLLATQPRYAQVIRSGAAAGEFAAGLQRAGYATDPQYGAKLAAVIRSAQALRTDS